MKLKTKMAVLVTAVAVGLIAASAASSPGQRAIGEFLTLIGAANPASPVAITQRREPDVEQRARARHGWTGSIRDAVLRGTITYYHSDLVVRQARLTVYRKFPDQVRLEEEFQGLTRIFGYGAEGAWRARTSSLGESEARDIRGWLRIFPDRLFAARSANGRYTEVGGAADESLRGERRRPGEPRPQRLVDQVDIEDLIGGADSRVISYRLDRETSVIESAIWLEPDDPSRPLEDPGLAWTAMRVDFDGWRRVEGALWPMEITRHVGGRLDFRIRLSGVLVNQQLPDSVFRDPGR